MNVNFFFQKIGDSEVIQLPYVPEKIERTVDGNLEEVDVINLGTVLIPKTPKPIEISFECFFPISDYLPDIRTKGHFWKPKEYINYFMKALNGKYPLDFVASGIGIHQQVLISDFKPTNTGGTDDVSYELTLKQYRKIKISTIPLVARYTKPKAIKPKPNKPSASAPAAPKQVTPGCDIILNGRVHRDSYGNGPGKTFSNYRGKVNFVKTDGRSHPYHVTTPSGGWLGWVVPSAIQVV